MPKTRAGSGQVKTNLQFQGSAGIVIPVGTTAERNPTPQPGEIRFNTDVNAFEGYTGSVWGTMGPFPFFNVEYFTGDGTTSEFDLGFSATNADLVIVTLNGVTLTAGRDFDLSYPDRIRFIELDGSTVNPPAENAEITVRYFSPLTTASIPAGTITAQEFAATGTSGQILSLNSSGELQWITIPPQTPALGGSYLEGTTANAAIKENVISVRELAVSPGLLGQVLATDGAGNLTFITVSGGSSGGSAGSFFDLSGTIALAQIPDNYIPQSKIDINGAAVNGYVLSTNGTVFQWAAPTAGADTALSNIASTAINASLLPATDSTVDLGSSTNKWRDLYLSGSTLYLGTAQITATGSAINLPAGSTVAGSNISAASNSFATISVAGQSNVVADSSSDTLTLVAGSGISITTNDGTDTVTITNASPNVAQDVFSTIAVAGQSNVVADSSSDTLTLVAGSGMSITTNANTDTVTIASTVTSGISLTALSVTVNSASGGGNLAYNNTTGVFSFTPPDFPSSLTALSDVIISSPSNGQVLKYNSSTSRWVNAADQTGQGGAGISLTDLSVTTAAASSNGALSYSNTTGIFTFTPPNLSSFISLTSISASGDISYNNSTGAITFNNATGYITRAGVSVSTASASAGGSLSYNNSTGVFTFTPADVSSFATNSFTTISVAGQSNVVADSSSDTLTLVAGSNITITTDAGTDTITINSAGGSASNSFATIAVAGQSNVVADSSSDTLTLVAGSGISITTNDSTDTITVTNASPNVAQNVFSTIAVAGQSSVEADSATDTLTLAAGTGISITTNASTDTVTITSTVSAGATAFTGLSDVSSASLTVDKIYLPAITMLNVTNNGASSYRFDQYGATDNPTVYALNGAAIAFNLNVAGHPFLIQTSGGSNYNEGLTHVTTGGVVTTGASAQGKTSGTLYWKIPFSISGNYRYICSIHGGMVGVITIKDFSAI